MSTFCFLFCNKDFLFVGETVGGNRSWRGEPEIVTPAEGICLTTEPPRRLNTNAFLPANSLPGLGCVSWARSNFMFRHSHEVSSVPTPVLPMRIAQLWTNV